MHSRNSDLRKLIDHRAVPAGHALLDDSGLMIDARSAAYCCPAFQSRLIFLASDHLCTSVGPS